jgi:hypothetical protein
MRRLRPSSEAEMVALFLRTELAAARFRDKLQALLESYGLPERVITDPDLDDDAENQARLRLLTQHREYGTRAGLFEGFPDDVRWQWMAITPAELARVRYIDYDYWVELSGGTRLAVDAAPRIRAGVAPFGVSFHRQSSRYPASSMLRTRRRNRLSRIFSASAESMTEWSKLPKQSAISPSMNQVVPVQVLATSRSAVWHPRRGRKPCEQLENCGS